MIHSGVYIIHNLKNGRKYIGQSINIRNRFKTHKSRLRKNKHPNHQLQQDWNQQSGEAFDFQVYKYCETKTATKLEYQLIQDNLHCLYNSQTHVRSLKSIPSSKFWVNVQRGSPQDCWEWQGSISKKGYGVLYHNQTNFFAHRVSYFLHSHKDPGPLSVRHLCHNCKCVNPAHLELGSRSDNALDSSILDIATVKKLRQQGCGYHEIARRFHCNHKTVEGFCRNNLGEVPYGPCVYAIKCSKGFIIKKARRFLPRPDRVPLQFCKLDTLDILYQEWVDYWGVEHTSQVYEHKEDLYQRVNFNFILSKINNTAAGCQEWQGVLDIGRGQTLRFKQKIAGRLYTFSLHRVLYFFKYKKLPPPAMKRVCDNPLCVNPDHYQSRRDVKRPH